MHYGDKIIIGIGGNIGSGKTTVSMIFKKLGARYISADAIGWAVLKDIADSLKEKFGDEIMDNQNINKVKLREYVFSNQENLDYLNKLSHPLLKSRLLKELDEIESGMVIIDAALLFDWTDILEKLDRTILVSATTDNKKTRTLKQGFDVQHFKHILKYQKKEYEMSKFANYIIKNNGTVQDLEEQCSIIYEEIRDDC